jgi:hypothetical protein
MRRMVSLLISPLVAELDDRPTLGLQQLADQPLGGQRTSWYPSSSS